MTAQSSGVPSDVHAQSGDRLVPKYSFQADGMSISDNAAAWRDAIMTLYEVDDAPCGGQDGAFRADLASYALGPAVLGLFRATGQRFRRTLDTIARSGVDHIVVQFHTRGGFEGVAGGRPILVREGDVCVLDFAQVVDQRTTEFESIVLFVPRPKWTAQMLNPQALHGLVLPKGNVAGTIIGRHLQALAELAPFIPISDCDALVEGSINLIVACLRVEFERNAVPIEAGHIDLLIRIKQHIDTALDQAHLSGDTVAAQFGLSRAALYRHFTPYGGVATYIRTRRLHRAFFDLTLPGVLVRDVAERWHLGSEENFMRTFKAAYGITPRMARTIALTSHENAASSNASLSQFSRWIRNMSPPAPAGTVGGRDSASMLARSTPAPC